MRRAARVVYLGTLCARGHDYENTGQSLRHRHGQCCQCFKLNRERRLQDPSKRAKEIERWKKLAARRRKGTRKPATKEGRREIQRRSKAKARRERAEQCRAYGREFYKKNSLRIRLRNRVSKALRQQAVKKVLALAQYGIDLAAIAAHIGPCPGPGAEWEIDHVRPLASFDLSDRTQLVEAFAPKNHQWLPKQENRFKAAKYG